ncbi:unnamed protein product [Clonostachys byssicola]|uniref:Glycoside hydrolase 131 catalytic N-terminal domain-containing protein n=1 Tax=Clonostachys byssicola TaxID=160290 RepID=A0A9N9Y3H3_9HYPO|nr:unnamed protein product [Clonostachys byssicola]
MFRSSILSILFGALQVTAQTCQLQFDGRIPKNLTSDQFDVQNGLFNPDFVKGKGLKFSELLEITDETTLFDVNSVPVYLTINDSSIFAPSETNVQKGFRRAELLPASNSGSDPSTTGIKTLHFSLAKDPARPLNFSHEYQLVFLESADYSTNQFVLKTGTILGGNISEPDSLQVYGNVNKGAPLIFQAPFSEGVVHNFALKLDFDALTTQVYYSQDDEALKPVTNPTSNDISGQGQFHFGILKKPTGPAEDITREGYQPSGIEEAILYGGIFEEDSADGCISLSPETACQRRAH